MTATPKRINVGDLMRRPDPANLLRSGDLRLLDDDKAPTPPPQPERPASAVSEPANRRVGLSLTAAQEEALKKKAGDVPLSRWVVRYLERQRVIPAGRTDQDS